MSIVFSGMFWFKSWDNWANPTGRGCAPLLHRCACDSHFRVRRANRMESSVCQHKVLSFRCLPARRFVYFGCLASTRLFPRFPTLNRASIILLRMWSPLEIIKFEPGVCWMLRSCRKVRISSISSGFKQPNNCFVYLSTFIYVIDSIGFKCVWSFHWRRRIDVWSFSFSLTPGNDFLSVNILQSTQPKF